MTIPVGGIQIKPSRVQEKSQFGLNALVLVRQPVMPGDERGQQQHRPGDEDQHDADDHVEVPLARGDRTGVVHHAELQHVASAEQEHRQRCEKEMADGAISSSAGSLDHGAGKEQGGIDQTHMRQCLRNITGQAAASHIVLLAEQTHIVRYRRS